MAQPFRFRIPVLELLAALHGDALSRSSRPLTNEERCLLGEVFGESLDLDAIRIAETSFANSPTTLGNSIRLRKGASLPPWVLVHEAMHVWQFQTQGTAYVSDSAFHQGVSLLLTGSRAAAYEVTLAPGRSIHDYTAEQQAMIVENAFQFAEWRDNPEVRRLLEEVRSARPLTPEAIAEEAARGPGFPLFRIEL
ncbi:MAG: hypothetical protein SFV51_01595 [Bryobacteraceae bacterium]|nr:hypothetical protein [Bryobacteraceae bacterium]